MLKGGGGSKFWGIFFCGSLKFSHTERGVQKVSTLKRWGRNNFYRLDGGGGGGGQKVSDPRFSHFGAPLPVIKDQSLRLQLDRHQHLI